MENPFNEAMMAARMARYSLELQLRNASERTISGDHITGLRIATDVRSKAKEVGDISLEALAVFEIARSRLAGGDRTGCVAAASWLITKLEDPSIRLDIPLDYQSLTYAYWAEAAIGTDAFRNDGAIELTKSWERFVRLRGGIEWLPQVLHTRSKVLRALKRLPEARDAAEEGIVRKRLSPVSPGCALSCHLSVFATVLRKLGQTEDALRVLRENLDFETSASNLNSMAWAMYELANDLETAEGFARQAVAIEPGRLAFFQTLAAILVRQDKWTEGSTMLFQYLNSPDCDIESAWEEDALAFSDAVKFGHTKELHDLLGPLAHPSEKRAVCNVYHALGLICYGDPYLVDRVAENTREHVQRLAKDILHPIMKVESR
jgi:tetratricopeptide (TPR) repeat protein